MNPAFWVSALEKREVSMKAQEMKIRNIKIGLLIVFVAFAFVSMQAQELDYKSLKTEEDGFQWYCYNYKKNSNGKWPTAAFDLNGKRLTCTTEHLIFYRNGYFEVWTDVNYKGDHVYAIYSRNGNCIVSNCSKWDCQREKNTNYLKFKTNGAYGLYDLENDRQVLVPCYEGIWNLDGTNYWEIKENGKYGLHDLKTDKQILSSFFDQLAIIEDMNGEVFVKATIGVLNGIHNPSSTGFYDISGTEILAPEFQDCAYLGSNLFKFKLNGYWGVMNRQGKIIIPISRHYTSIDYSRTLKMFTFMKETDTQYFKGECNANGVQTSIEKTGTKSKPQPQAQQPAKQEPKKEVKQEPKSTSKPTSLPQPQAVQVWKPCVVCKGSGLCANCGGSGQDQYSVSTYRECPTCHGTKKCSYCAGQGGHYEVEYH